jgi:hypothetical protein
VPGIFLGKALPQENVAQVPAAIVAQNLGAATISIGFAAHRSGHFIIEARPTAARIKLVTGLVQRGVAAAAHVGSGCFVVPILARKWVLGPFVDDYVFFLCTQWIVWHFGNFEIKTSKSAKSWTKK